MKGLKGEVKPVNIPTFADALKIAKGCTDYGGGYGSNPRDYEIYQHGIRTVINALTAAASGEWSAQTAVLHRVGGRE